MQWLRTTATLILFTKSAIQIGLMVTAHLCSHWIRLGELIGSPLVVGAGYQQALLLQGPSHRVPHNMVAASKTYVPRWRAEWQPFLS